MAVFISHDTHDAAIANKIVERLERDGVGCWIAPRDIPPGSDYSDAIVDGVTAAPALVFLLSKESIDSDYCRAELDIAREIRIPIFPVRLDETEPTGGFRMYLAGRQRLDATGAEDGWLTSLSDAVKQRVPSGQPTVTASTAKPGGGRGDLYRIFWAKYLARAQEAHPEWSRPRTPSSVNWMGFKSPLDGSMLMPLFRSGARVGHDLYIDTGEEASSKALFDTLLVHRATFEAAYGAPLEWLRLEGKRACRVGDSRAGSVDVVADHDQYVDWLIERGERMRRALESLPCDLHA